MRAIVRISTPVLVLLSLAAVAGAAKTGDASRLPSKVTYARHVAPVLAERCVVCHRPGDIAPMSLREYDEVRPWAKSIRRVIDDGTMPPWHASPEYGRFRNDRSLSPHEKALILRWVKQGAPMGDPSEIPELPERVEGWRLGEPDLVVTFDEVSLPAGGPDVFEDLKARFEIPEDRWIKAIEVLPGNRQVVHHVIVYALAARQGSPNGWLGAWAAGMEPMVFPPGTGRVLTKGSTLVADLHYHPADEEAVDRTRVGLYFHDQHPAKEMVNLWIQNAGFRIPAGAENHEVRASHTFQQDSVVHALLPHMHYRGKDFTYTAHFPDGREEILLKVDDYDFNWQTVYQLKEPLELPKGSKIKCVAHYDNSSKNPDNPDPSRNVTFGDESYDEMMIGFVDYTVKEGLRPQSAEDRIGELLSELARENPEAVFSTTVTQDEFSATTVLYLPAKGDGSWHIPINGQVYEARVTSLEGDADGFTARVLSPFSPPMTIRGSGAFGRSQVQGTLLVPGEGEMSYEGVTVKRP